MRFNLKVHKNKRFNVKIYVCCINSPKKIITFAIKKIDALLMNPFGKVQSQHLLDNISMWLIKYSRRDAILANFQVLEQFQIL